MASETRENNVRVYLITNQAAESLSQVQSQWNLDRNALGGYISIVLATHLSMCRRPGSTSELEALVSQVGSAVNHGMAASCNRLIAMIRQRRMEYYKSHRREFVPESVDEGSKSPSRGESSGGGSGSSCGSGGGSGSTPKSPLGKYSDRLSLSAYLSAPMSEADISYALINIIGFVGSNVAVLRTVKPEPKPSTFLYQTTININSGNRGAEEHRIAHIQQRAFFGNDVFIETSRIREAQDVDIAGCKGVGGRADGLPSVYDQGCGLVTHCIPIHTHVGGLVLTSSNFMCYPFIIDVSSGSMPSYNGSGSCSENEGAGSIFRPVRLGQGHGHHVLGFPVVLEGRKVLVVLDSLPRVATYKSEGHIYPQERILADSLNYMPDGRRQPLPDEAVSPMSFAHRRCKLCQVVHSSDMHAEFQ